MTASTYRTLMSLALVLQLTPSSLGRGVALADVTGIEVRHLEGWKSLGAVALVGVVVVGALAAYIGFTLPTCSGGGC